MSAGLAARGVSLTLGAGPARKAVLHEASLALRAGEVTAIIGPNGAGKSSLLACLAGLRGPDRGTVLLDDRPLAQVPPRERARRIGFLPQVAEINWDIDVATLVSLGRLPHQGRWGLDEADRAAINAALAATDTAQFAARIVSTLSGGERARALLARVLAGEPEFLLADEPLANLDPRHQFESLALLRRAAAQGTGVVVVLHDLAHALRVADRVVLMQEGRIIADDAPAAVLTPERIAAAYGVASHAVTLPDGATGLVLSGPC
ncbi:MAG: ABC transporter ATP-binding protein [Erythrobacter sp.]